MRENSQIHRRAARCCGARLIDGPFEGGHLDEVAKVRFLGASEKKGMYAMSAFGSNVALPGDLTGEGSGDIANWGDRADNDEKAWHVFSGPFEDGEEIEPAEAEVFISAAAEITSCDFDLDGRADYCSSMGILTGPIQGELSSDDFTTSFSGKRIQVADLDGGGRSSLVVAQSAAPVEGMATIAVLRKMSQREKRTWRPTRMSYGSCQRMTCTPPGRHPPRALVPQDGSCATAGLG